MSADQERLDSIRFLLLASEWSTFGANCERIERAIRYQHAIEVAGHRGYASGAIRALCKHYDLPYREDFSIALGSDAAIRLWEGSCEVGCERVYIPAPNLRQGDSYPQLPILIDLALNRLRDKNPRFPNITMEAVAALWLTTAVTLTPLLGSYGSIVSRALINAEDDGRITMARLPFLSPEQGSDVVWQAVLQPKPTQLYLGVWDWPSETERGEDRFPCDDHIFNIHSGNLIQESTDPKSPSYGLGIQFPYMRRNFIWRHQQIPVGCLNVRRLTDTWRSRLSGLPNMVYGVLKLRLIGVVESKIGPFLKFADEQAYTDWAKENWVCTDPCAVMPSEKWRESVREIGLDSDVVAKWALTDKWPEASPASANPTAKSRKGIMYDPDYMSISLPDGRHISLTRQQGRVIEFLHIQQANGVLEASAGTIVEEVYGQGTDNSLKRKFRPDTSRYDALIVAGSRRGLVKLRHKWPDLDFDDSNDD